MCCYEAALQLVGLWLSLRSIQSHCARSDLGHEVIICQWRLESIHCVVIDHYSTTEATGIVAHLHNVTIDHYTEAVGIDQWCNLKDSH